MTSYERNTEIATKIMGWRKGIVSWCDAWLDGGTSNIDFTSYVLVMDWRPTECITDAFLVIERMRKLGWDSCEIRVETTIDKRPVYSCRFNKPHEFFHYQLSEQSAAEAICLAALMVMEAKK